jgi:hypothetical protein
VTGRDTWALVWPKRRSRVAYQASAASNAVASKSGQRVCVKYSSL